MAKITYIEPTGVEHQASVENGMSIMQGAVFNNIPGIDAECGGACVCATCHVNVSEEWIDKLEAPSDVEMMTLEEVEGITENSRLSCQMLVTDALDGLVVHLPEEQG